MLSTALCPKSSLAKGLKSSFAYQNFMHSLNELLGLASNFLAIAYAADKHP